MDTHRKNFTPCPTLQSELLVLASNEINLNLTNNNRESGYAFICLNAWNIQLLVSPQFAHYVRSNKCVLLINRSYLLLALYFYYRMSSVVTVIDSRMDINSIKLWLNTIDGKKRLPHTMHHVSPLNYEDISLIKQILSGKSMSAIARTMKINIKTLYSRQSRIACKFNVPTLGRLMCPALTTEERQDDRHLQVMPCFFDGLPIFEASDISFAGQPIPLEEKSDAFDSPEILTDLSPMTKRATG